MAKPIATKDDSRRKYCNRLIILLGESFKKYNDAIKYLNVNYFLTVDT